VLALRVLAVALALVTARLVAADLATLHRRAATLGELRPVLVARHDLPLGHRVDADDLRVVERHAGQVPGAALRTPADAVGRTVVVPLVADAPLLAAHLAAADRHSVATLIAPGHVAIRIADSEGLRPPVGSVVQVLAPVAIGTAIELRSGGRADVVVERARVLEVGDDGTTRTVLVEVLVADAPRLASATANGVLTLALLPPEDACCADASPSSPSSSVDSR
jgi:Flp pilus assembly protein CpaB